MATTDTAMAESSAPLKNSRRANGSPSHSTHLTKTHKKRQGMQDDLASRASQNQEPVLREQLQQTQVDMSLISGFDHFSGKPLDAYQQEHLLRSARERNSENDGANARRSLYEVAGHGFDDYAQEIADLIEERDFALAKSQLDLDRKQAELRATRDWKIETALREHKAHERSINDRLINNMASKKMRLTKDKENTDLTEGSAGHLHPNQFSLTNPASPGGTQSKRATRHRRDLDEAGGGDNKKRKRNPGEEDGSPAPQRRALDLSSTTPIWQNDRLANRKATGAVYSIDKLFTDKELSMTYNTAAMAAHKYLLTHKPRYDELGQPISSAEDSDSGGEHDGREGSEPGLSAPMMERNVSHATRSARGGANSAGFVDDKLMGLEALANFDSPANFERMMAADPKLPPTFPSTYIKNHAKQSDFNTPTVLGIENVNQDLALMAALTQHDEKFGKGATLDSEIGTRKLLETVSRVPRDQRFTTFLQGSRPPIVEIRQRLGLPPARQERRADGEAAAGPEAGSTPSKTGRSGTPANPSPAKAGGGPTSAPAPGGVPMSRQSSAGGAVPMSRSSSRKGRSVVRGG